MADTVTSKNGLTFLTPAVLAVCITDIEKCCPGWWYSISQKKDHVCVTMGPGRNGPHAPDLEFALTREGGEGRSLYHEHVGGKVDEKDLVASLRQFITSFNANRKLTNLPDSGITFERTDLPKYRSQSTDDVAQLLIGYIDFLNGVKSIEDRGHVIEEIYLGSCDLSADCSLRGKRVDDSEFDVTFDLLDDGTIAEALSWSFVELKSDALTPRK